MSLELIYTSVPRGLKPGSKGFCTVARSAQMQAALAERLELLTGYRAIFPLGSARAAGNPVNWCHYRMSARSLLARVAFAGVDYSQRSNKFAHLVVLDEAEQPAAGPAWLVSQPGFMRTEWTGEPQLLTSAPIIPNAGRPPRPCDAWTAASGDAGWAGALAASFVENRSKPAYVIYPSGTNVLALFEEAISLLEPATRWQVTFSTFFTQLPVGFECAWRGIPDESPHAREVRQSTAPRLLIDLTQPLPAPPPSPFVIAAREGSSPPAIIRKSAPAAAAPTCDRPPEDSEPAPTRNQTRARSVPEALAEFTDEYFAPTPSQRHRSPAPIVPQPRRSKLPYIALAATVAVALSAFAAVFLFMGKTSAPAPTAGLNPTTNPNPDARPSEEVEVENAVKQLHAAAKMADDGDPDGAEKTGNEVKAQYSEVMNDANVARAMTALNTEISSQRQSDQQFEQLLQKDKDDVAAHPNKADLQALSALAHNAKQKGEVDELQAKLKDTLAQTAEEDRQAKFESLLKDATVAALDQAEALAKTDSEKARVNEIRSKIAKATTTQPGQGVAVAPPTQPARPTSIVEIPLRIPEFPKFGLKGVAGEASDSRLPAHWDHVTVLFPNGGETIDCASGTFSASWANGGSSSPLILRRLRIQTKSLATTMASSTQELDLRMLPKVGKIRLEAADFEAADEIVNGILGLTKIEITAGTNQYNIVWNSSPPAIQMVLGATLPSTQLPKLQDQLESYARLAPPVTPDPGAWNWVRDSDGVGLVGVLPADPDYKTLKISFSSAEPIQVTDNYAECLRQIKRREDDLDTELKDAEQRLTDAKKASKPTSETQDSAAIAQQERDKINTEDQAAKNLFNDFTHAATVMKPFEVQVTLQNDVTLATLKVLPPKN
jgi:GTPase-associated protein 1, N-terminal domain type 2/GTPase-associated protein 1, middle domain